jgi:hypothetical protein
VRAARWHRRLRRGSRGRAAGCTSTSAPGPRFRQAPGPSSCRLPLGAVGGWVDPCWRPGPRRVPRCDPGGTAALGATWEVVPIELPAHGGGGRVQRLSPAPRSRFRAVPRTPARASVPLLESDSDDRAEAGYQCSHDDAQRADSKTRGAGGVAVRRRGTASEAPCSQIAHRRCAYTWTSQHTSVASMQVGRATLDTSVRRGTGWPGSNPGIPIIPRQAITGSTPSCRKVIAGPGRRIPPSRRRHSLRAPGTA